MDSKRERYNKYKREYAKSHPWSCDKCGLMLHKGSKNRHQKQRRYLERPDALIEEQPEARELSYRFPNMKRRSLELWPIHG